jgi:hypothetical protein
MIEPMKGESRMTGIEVAAITNAEAVDDFVITRDNHGRAIKVIDPPTTLAKLASWARTNWRI